MTANETKWWNGPVKAEPDFNNLLKVLRREVPNRPTLFEFFMNGPLYRSALNGGTSAPRTDRYDGVPHGEMLRRMAAFRALGYDYVTVQCPGFDFPRREQACKQTISLNEAFVITDRKSFDSCLWPDPDKADYSFLDRIAAEMPSGMKMIVYGPCGVLENANFMLGYENMCYMIADDRQLVEDVFEAIGSRLVRYYTRVLEHEGVGAIIGNDDWGFKSQPMLSPDDMRGLVFPWHREIVATAHKAGKPAILHSCGNLASVMDDITGDIHYDGKHSYEDTIIPVEQAYEQYGSRIATLGGMDLNFVVRSSPDEVYGRAKRMIEKTSAHGGYALGTGNSVPEYVPRENYFAMIRAATENR